MAGMGQMRSVPQSGIEKLLASLGQGSESARGFMNENLGIPFVDTGIGAGDMIFGEGPELLNEMSWGKSPIIGSGMAARIDPRIVDVGGIAGLFGGLGKNVVKAGMKDLLSPRAATKHQRGSIDWGPTDKEHNQKLADEYKAILAKEERTGTALHTDTPDDLGWQPVEDVPQKFSPNYVHGRSMDHGTDDIEHPLMLMSNKPNQLQDFYSGSAWGDSAPANFPFEFNPKNSLNFDHVESISAVDDILKSIGKVDEFPMDESGFLTEAGQDALRKYKRGYSDDGDLTQLIDLAYVPEFRAAAKKRGYDALVMDKDSVPGPEYIHDTMVPLDFKDVKGIGGILDDLLKRNPKYGK